MTTNLVVSRKNHHNHEKLQKSTCRDPPLGQRFLATGRGKDPLQDEDHSGSRPHSFPGYFLVHSGWAPE